LVSRNSLIKIVFIIAALVFMMVFILRNAKQIEYLPETPDISVLLLSMFIVWCGFISVILIWKYFLKSYGERITTGQAYTVYFRSNLGKYLPGKVWQLAGMAYLCSELGIKPKKSIPASLYNQVLAMLTGVAIFFTCAYPSDSGLVNGYLWYTLFGGVMTMFILYPNILTRLMNFSLRFIGKSEVTEEIGRGVLFTTIVLYVLAWGVFGWGFSIFLRFLGIRTVFSIPEATGILSGSVSIGFLAFFAPGGLGVREGIMVFLLEKYHPLKMAVFISVAARLWLTAVELIGFLSTYVLSLIPQKGSGVNGTTTKK